MHADSSDHAPHSTALDRTHPVIFYDGVCGLCNRFVQFVLRFDRRGVVRFATLQGELGTNVRASYPHTANVDSIVFVWEGTAHVRSAAALRIFGQMGGLWPLMRAFLVIPQPVRDFVYDWIARNRYGWFGKLDACPIPAPAVRARFLD